MTPLIVMNNNKSFWLLVITMMSLMAAAPRSTMAFRSPILRQQRRFVMAKQTVTFLHPDQAADLEACAYDLMKHHLEEQQRKREMRMNNFKTAIDPDTMEEPAFWLFPARRVSWARRRLWPFGRNNNNQAANLRP